MPAPGVTPPKFNTNANEPETRVAQPVYDKPSWLDGKRTFIGLALTALGTIANMFQVDVPTEEINGALDIVSLHWDVFAQLIGLVVAAWGRVKASKRFKEKLAAAKS